MRNKDFEPDMPNEKEPEQDYLNLVLDQLLGKNSRLIIYDVWDIDREEFVGTTRSFEEAKELLGEILFFGADTSTEVAFRNHSVELRQLYADDRWNEYYPKLTEVYKKYRKQQPKKLSEYWYRTHIVVSKRTSFVTTQGRFQLTEGIV